MSKVSKKFNGGDSHKKSVKGTIKKRSESGSVASRSTISSLFEHELHSFHEAWDTEAETEKEVSSYEFEGDLDEVAGEDHPGSGGIEEGAGDGGEVGDLEEVVEHSEEVGGVEEATASHEQSPKEQHVPEIPQIEIKLEKPQVWVRMSSRNSSICNFEIGHDKKTLILTIRPEDRISQRKSGKTVSFSFETEGILQEREQDEVYDLTVKTIVENAFDGVNGVVLCVGPEASGKSFTLFGSDGQYPLRGIVIRAIEDIFNILPTKEKSKHNIILSMFEVRKEKIKDLLTLSPNDLSKVGDFGPKGLFFEEVLSVDHALGLILRGLAGQQQLPRDHYSRSHTVIYIDILASIETCAGQPPEEWRSRITFAKIAAVPAKSELKKTSTPRNNFSLCRSGCIGISPRKDACYSPDAVYRKCCGGPQGALGEMISIRKDMAYLEQMLTMNYDSRKMNEYYHELHKMGMSSLARPPKYSSPQYFRQNKLAHCLKDIASGTALIRLIIHIRAEASYLQQAVELMRLAESARFTFSEIPIRIGKICPTTENKMAQICEDTGFLNSSEIDAERMKDVFKVAITNFEEKLETLEGPCKDHVKTLFEGFKEMWTQMVDHEIRKIAEENNEGEEDYEEEGGDGEKPAIGDHSTHSHKKLLYHDSKISTKKGKQSDDLKSMDPKEKRKRRPPTTAKGSALKSKNKNRSTLETDESETDGKKRNKNKRSNVEELSTTADEDNADDDTEAGLASEEQVAIPGTVSNSSSSVVVVEGSTQNSIQLKRKCWKQFTKSEAGAAAIADFKEKQNSLKQSIDEHTETLKALVESLAHSVQHEFSRDHAEQDRLLEGAIDESGNLLPSSKETQLIQKIEAALPAQQELIENLKSHRCNILQQLSALEASKKECEKAFETHTTDTFGKSLDASSLPLSTLSHTIATVAQEILGFPKLGTPECEIKPDDEDLYRTEKDSSEAEKKFEDLYRMAKNAANAIIKSGYSKRPKWIN